MRSPPVSSYRPAWLLAAADRTLAVLGADGFIGSHVVRLSLAAGARALALCVAEPWRLAGIGDPRLELRRVPAGRLWEASYADELAAALERADAVVHLAYRPPVEGASEAERRRHERAVNADGTARIGDVAARLGLPLVFASTADVYGPWHTRPVSEDVAPAPVTPYAEAKLEAEECLAGRADCVSLRIATVFGPGENGPRAIPTFAGALLAGRRPVVHGDGSDVRDYVHVCDVAAAAVNAALAPPPEDVLNVASGVGRSTLETLGAVSGTLDAGEVSPELVAAPRPRSSLVLSPARARRALRFEPRLDFERAVAEEVAWLSEAADEHAAHGAAGGRR